VLRVVSELRLRKWQSIAFTVIIPTAALGLNWIVAEDPFKAMIMLPIVAVMAVSLVGGFFPGLASIIIGAVGLALLVLEPTGSMWISWPAGLIDELIFLAVALVSWKAVVDLRCEMAKVRERDDAIAAAAHDLRSPLNALVLTIEGIRFAHSRLPDSEHEERLTSALNMLERQVRKMADMVDGLFTIPRSFSERYDYGDLADIVRECLHDMQPQLTEARSSIDLEAEPVAGSWNRLGIRRLMSNLVGNAIKYAAGSPISVRVGRDGSQAQIEIADCGPGIDSAMYSRIFEPYERGHSQHGDGGSGLGLYIARKIVEAHNGRIALMHTAEGGARFLVTLPIMARFPAERQAASASTSKAASPQLPSTDAAITHGN
jgi:signal transduction histidine kinase